MKNYIDSTMEKITENHWNAGFKQNREKMQNVDWDIMVFYN